MAGKDTTGAFNGAAFRQQITSVMTMALPNTKQLQPTFQWTAKPVYQSADQAGNPFDWTKPAVQTSPQAIADLQVPCAVSYALDDEMGTDAGEINEEKITITLLDTQYNQLLAHGSGELPDKIVCSGATYTFDYVVEVALFDVDVYTVHASSADM